MAYNKSFNPSEYRNDGKVSWWKQVKKPFLYMGTALALLVGGVLGYNALNKANTKRDAKEEPIVQKATQPAENNLKKAVSKLAQKETAANSKETATNTQEAVSNVQETAASNASAEKAKPKTRMVVDYQFAIVPGLASDQVHLDPAVARELAKNYRMADMAMDNWVASKIQALKGNDTRAKQYENAAIRQFPELAKCRTFQDVAFELYKKKAAAGINTSSARAKISYSYLQKAARATNPESRLKHLYKAVTLVPEVGIMGPNLEVAREIALSFKGENHVVMRAQLVEVPLTNAATPAMLAAQAEGR